MDLPALLGNEPQIQQVLLNLVLNASDALAGKDGVITVKTSRDAAGRNSLAPSAAGSRERSCVRLEVSDTGAGISKEMQAKIFDPFFTTKVRGRGLGLAVVLGIVRAHNGTIEVDSAPAQGTTFRILWPLADQASGRTPDVEVREAEIRPGAQRHWRAVRHAVPAGDESDRAG